MKNFLYKEFKLCLSAVNYIFILFTAMILIPNYPCYVPFFYLCLSIFFIFNNSELNKDIPYSMILPIKKSDMVKSRCILIYTYQLIGTIFTIPFALILHNFIKLENQAGIECNIAFYGLILITMAVFNFVFLTSFYKTAKKPGKAFVKGCIVFWILYLVLETPIWLKNLLPTDFFIRLDSIQKSDLSIQFSVLVFGIVFYVITCFATFKVSSKRFEKVDL
mgnify:CR=1 FL=1